MGDKKNLDARNWADSMMRHYDKGLELRNRTILNDPDYLTWFGNLKHWGELSDKVIWDLFVAGFINRTIKVPHFYIPDSPRMYQYLHDLRVSNELPKFLADLEGIIDNLEYMANTPGGQKPSSFEQQRLASVPVEVSLTKIFVVHGRDDGARETVARFIESLGLQAVILREMPNLGRAVIEKFLDYADVGFAVVLLTPDDRGGLATEPFEFHKPRARQNVLLELGFFLAKLGRDRVAVLYWPGVEIPSDYSGVLFTEFDSRGAWRGELAREFASVGLHFDPAKLLGR